MAWAALLAQAALALLQGAALVAQEAQEARSLKAVEPAAAPEQRARRQVQGRAARSKTGPEALAEAVRATAVSAVQE